MESIMGKIYYYIFGIIANEYTSLNYPEFLKSSKDNMDDWDIHIHRDGTNPTTLLEAFDGWRGYSMIPKQTYEILKRMKANDSK